MSALDEARERLRIPQLWSMLGLRGEAGTSCCSPFREDRHPSFSVFDEGRRFKDFGHPEHHGDAVDFLAIARGLCASEAARELIRMAGLAAKAPPAAGAAKTAPEPTRLQAMPADVAAIWEEGLRFLRSSEIQHRRIADWRGWTPEFVATLAQDGLMGMPMHRGVRGMGFPVHCPASGGEAQTIGFHFRFPARGGRARWAFVPQGVPAVPFVVGTFQGAKLLVITEGQWDALTLCHAAGWFDHDAAWPDPIAVVAVRGSGTWRCFMGAYRRLWPRDPAPNCLLLCDADDAGRRWYEGSRETFFSSLGGACRKVVATRPQPPAKDVNDAFRAGIFTPRSINGILMREGFVDAKGRAL